MVKAFLELIQIFNVIAFVFSLVCLSTKYLYFHTDNMLKGESFPTHKYPFLMALPINVYHQDLRSSSFQF